MIYEGSNAVGFREINRQSNYRRSYIRVGKRLVSAKPTVYPTIDFNIRRLERGWFSQTQPALQRWCYHMRVGKQLIFMKPTVIWTMGFNIRWLKRSWFSEKQPSIQPHSLLYVGWKTVSFCKTNLYPNHTLYYTALRTRLVFAKPTFPA